MREPRTVAPLLFTHDDLDGIGAAVIARARYGDTLEFRQCSTQEINAAVAEYLDAPDGRPLLITDISVRAEVAARLQAYAAKTTVTLLDHHQTALWLNQYAWATVRTDACGTLLAYQRLQPGASYDEFARVVDDYDRWQQHDPRSTELNRLYELVGPERFLRRFVTRPEPSFTGEERLLLDVEAERLARYVDSADGTLERYDLAGVRAGICYADRSVTEVAAALIQRHELELIAVVNFHAHKVSLRSRGSVDVSTLAQRLGGGGHPGAAGFALPSEEASLVRESIARRIRDELRRS